MNWEDLAIGERILKRIAEEILGPEVSKKIWGRIDIVGDIAIIRKPFDVEEQLLKSLGEALLQRIPYIKSVWLDLGGVEEVTRVRNVIWLAGEKKSETIYKEHGCLFKLDIARAYISPRLSYEHIRIARLVQEGEVIANLFAGVGGFSIIIAKHAKPKKVISIDINEEAYRYMVENIKLNKVENIVTPILGDALEVIKGYRDFFDRILLPLPQLALVSLRVSIEALKKQGFIHPYDFVSARNKREALSISREIYSKELEKIDLVKKYEFRTSRVVRSVGPRRYQVVHDIWVVKN
ncbi:MAG: class I SAM-dependent methyltransferase [Sulfolobales archaeon]